MSFTSDAGDQAFRAAIAAIESASAVEVVVAVRAHARRWMVQHLVVGLIAALAVLIYAALRPLEAWAVIALPLATGLVAVLLVEWLPPLNRFLVPVYLRKLHAREASRALFVDRTIHATRGRTGMLVYIAVQPQVCDIVADVGVLDKLGQHTLDAYADKLAAAIPRGAEATANALTSFVPELASQIPRRSDDRNELPDASIIVPKTHV